VFAVLAAARFAHFTAAALLFGLAAFPFYAGASGPDPRRFKRALTLAAVAVLATGAIELLAMAANMGGSPASALDPEVLSAAVTDTDFGKVWLARLVLAALLVALRTRRRSAKDPVLAIGSALLLASIALTGHSAIPGGAIGALHQIADAAHLVAAGWWIGGLLALSWAARTLGDRAAAVLRRFSRIGYAAVAAIVLTGLAKSILLVGSVGALTGSAYGRVLLAKIALFCAMGGIALANRSWIIPALEGGGDRPRWLGRLRTQVGVEFALGLAVLAVVGALGAMAPPVAQ
jgi:putative copper resistance protein D